MGVEGRTGPRPGLAVVQSATVVVVALTLTWVFLGMRAVMDVGGACADGGPYVSAQPCPDTAAVLLSLGIPVMLLTAFIGTGVSTVTGAPDLLLPMWGFLFTSLGWNFIEHGFLTDGIVWGYAVCGVLFEVMGLPALWFLLPLNRLRSRPLLGAGGPPDASGDPPPSRLRWPAAYVVLSVVGVVLAVWTYRAWS